VLAGAVGLGLGAALGAALGDGGPAVAAGAAGVVEAAPVGVDDAEATDDGLQPVTATIVATAATAARTAGRTASTVRARCIRPV
jgi:hypothetical protein